MITHIATIQELTLQLYESHWDYFFNEKDMSRDQIFNMVENWSHVFEDAHSGYAWNGDYYDEIDRFLEFCVSEYKAGRFPTAESFLQKRITIGFCCTEDGYPVAGTLWEPVGESKPEHPMYVKYWDLNKMAWRQFSILNLVAVEG